MKEWPEEKYPPWAHGPGYVVSRDVARYVHRRHRSGQLKVKIKTTPPLPNPVNRGGG